MANLSAIVDALGGEIGAAGQRATVRAPGHSEHDRSVSLLLSGDRLIIHAFGSTDWREISLHLRDLGLIDRSGRVIGSGSGTLATRTSSPRPDGSRRLSAARALWDEAGPVQPGSASFRHLVSRVGGGQLPDGLRHHPGAPVSVFRETTARRPALVARVCDGGASTVSAAWTFLSVYSAELCLFAGLAAQDAAWLVRLSALSLQRSRTGH